MVKRYAELIRNYKKQKIKNFCDNKLKEQAAQILQEKVQDICTKIPAFKKEIDWNRGATREGKDACRYVFKSGSTLENLAARESSRGRRFHCGLMEECVGIDQKVLQEIIIPKYWGLVA